jgi:hypothetical protein
MRILCPECGWDTVIFQYFPTDAIHGRLCLNPECQRQFLVTRTGLPVQIVWPNEPKSETWRDRPPLL